MLDAHDARQKHAEDAEERNTGYPGGRVVKHGGANGNLQGCWLFYFVLSVKHMDTSAAYDG